MNNIKFTLFLISTITAQSLLAEIVPYNDSRDRDAVIKILDQEAKFLRYETRGYPAGYTERYITSPKYTTMVYRDNGKTVGFVNYCNYEAKLLWGLINYGKQCCIHLLGIAPNFRRKGYAQQLMQYVLEDSRLKKAQGAWLQLEDNNRAAIQLYKKCGFKTLNPAMYSIVFEENIPPKSSWWIKIKNLFSSK